jgi:hypothetical protein
MRLICNIYESIIIMWSWVNATENHQENRIHLTYFANKNQLCQLLALFSSSRTRPIMSKAGVVDNTKKSIDKGKTVASYCMGQKETYELLDENPTIEFKTIDYVNNPLIIAKNKLMTAINSAMKVDLTGQASAESLGGTFYFGVGGQADFMRGGSARAWRQEHSGLAVNCNQQHHFEDSAISPGGYGSDPDQRRCPLRSN